MVDTATESSLHRMMRLFEGYDGAYGTYEVKPGYQNISRGKVEIKSTAKTVREEVTEEHWAKHLDGIAPLGIIPIRENDTCLWGVIDVDVYGVSHIEIIETLKKHKLPLVVCRSKSGGAHLFLFLSKPAPAGDVQDFLREISVLIGWGSSEIFPKQRTVHLARGDLGSWLNMPYFNGDESDRHAVGPDGLGMTVNQFLKYAESLQQPPTFLAQTAEDFRDPNSPKSSPDFGDGPPCMQHLSSSGFPEGTRNKGLLALGVFAKKKYGTKWAEQLERWNRDLMDPPLPSSEVVGVIRQLERKDYYYTCKDQPLVAHCNSSVCRTRKFGVGGDDDFPVISGMSVLDTEPPLWFLDVEDTRVELTSDELQNYRAFHKVCMEQMFKCYRMMKQDDWLQVIGEQMRSAVRIEAPKEVGRSGQFYELLDVFLMDRNCSDDREELLMGRPWHDEQRKRYYFRLMDLTKHLENSNFRSFSRGQITTRISAMSGGKDFFNLRGKGVNVFYVPAEAFERNPEMKIPKMEDEPL